MVKMPNRIDSVNINTDILLRGLSSAVVVSKTKTVNTHYYRGVFFGIKDCRLEIVGTNGTILTICNDYIDCDHEVEYSTMFTLSFVEMMIVILKNIKRSHQIEVSNWRRKSKLSRGKCPELPSVNLHVDNTESNDCFFGHQFGISNIGEVNGYKEFNWVKSVINGYSYTVSEHGIKSLFVDPYLLDKMMSIFAAYIGSNSGLYHKKLRIEFLSSFKFGNSMQRDMVVRYSLEGENIVIFSESMKEK